MHPLYGKADELSHMAIGAAIEVHRLKGPGLIESIYERCLMRELELRQIAAVNQRLVKIEYKGLIFDEPLRFDVLVEGCLLLELKCVQEILPIHKAQLLSYMKLLNVPLGLIIEADRWGSTPDPARGQSLNAGGARERWEQKETKITKPRLTPSLPTYLYRFVPHTDKRHSLKISDMSFTTYSLTAREASSAVNCLKYSASNPRPRG